MNKFCDECLHYSICEKEGKDDPAMVFCDDRIAEAIPIEWIKKQIENPPYSHSWELGERWKGEYTTCLMVLLEDWEKENGPDK